MYHLELNKILVYLHTHKKNKKKNHNLNYDNIKQSTILPK